MPRYKQSSIIELYAGRNFSLTTSSLRQILLCRDGRCEKHLLRKRIHQPANTDGHEQKHQEGPCEVFRAFQGSATGAGRRQGSMFSVKVPQIITNEKVLVDCDGGVKMAVR
jgi:hypothetical protein